MQNDSSRRRLDRDNSPQNEPMTPEQERAIAEELRLGNKIEAIKLCREFTGMRLAEAKECVEAIESGKELVPPRRSEAAPANDSAVTEQIKEAVFAGNKILAIKLYRGARPGSVGLAEAKLRIEKLELELRAQYPDRFTSVPKAQGCTAVLLSFILTAAAAVWLML
jgi:ribosomal protein L7/L12